MLQPKKPMSSRVHLVLPDDLYLDIKFRADAAGITVAEAIRQYLEIAVRKDIAVAETAGQQVAEPPTVAGVAGTEAQ
ncbi:MAG: hypothetical protein OXJ55_07920 [Caldilineaceae bacterium]|nr:hypothetical protein [Caldilineaceae bacterium]